MSSILKPLTAVAALSFLAYAAQAQIITYVDATDGVGGNTRVAPSAGGGVFTPVNPQGPGGDGLWDVRAFGNDGTIYQNASSGNTDNAQRLQTSVIGLQLGWYNVYAYFWSDTSSWRMGASLSDEAGNLPLYQANPTTPGVVQYYSGADATVMSSSLAVNPFTSDVMIAEGNRRLYQVLVGTVYSSAFTVNIDDDPNMASSDQRTWYDGVGYAVVPEPTSAALMGLGALVGLFMVRRRA